MLSNINKTYNNLYKTYKKHIRTYNNLYKTYIFNIIWYIWLYFVMFCYDVLYFAMLCYVLLCWNPDWSCSLLALVLWRTRCRQGRGESTYGEIPKQPKPQKRKEAKPRTNVQKREKRKKNKGPLKTIKPIYKQLKTYLFWGPGTGGFWDLAI